MKPLAAAVLCLAVVACAPPYVAELDEAAGLVKQMTLVGTVGPVNVDQGATSVRFLPPKPTASSIGDVKVQSGFMVVDTPGQERLSFIYGSQENGDRTFPTTSAAAVAPYPVYQYDVTNTISNQASIIVSMIDGTPAGTYQQFTATLPNGSLNQVNSALNLASVVFGDPTANWYGSSPMPGPSSGLETFAFLIFTAGTYNDGLATMDGSATTFLFSSEYALLGFPALSRSLFYFSAATGASVADYYSGGQWNCIQWFGVGAVTTTSMTGVTHRIDAVLGTGDFLSTEDGTLHLYDPGGTGSEVRSLDLKGLQFCYEAYVGAAPYVFFVLPTEVRTGQRAFNVYAIPSSAMRTLHE